MEDSITTYKQLLNVTLPATYTYPVRFNHCFNRIVLDWLFQDCWYNYLNRRQTAISQLSVEAIASGYWQNAIMAARPTATGG